MKYLLLITILLHFSTHANSSASIRAFHSERIAVFGKPIRYIVRIFNREKKHSTEKCEEINDILMSQDDHRFSYQVNLVDLSVRTGGVKKSSIEFECSLAVESQSHNITSEKIKESFSLESEANAFCEKTSTRLDEDNPIWRYSQVYAKDQSYYCDAQAIYVTEMLR